MALQPDFDICQEECDILVLSETTGTYSDDNTGGWGAPNVEIDEVDVAELLITFPDGTTLTTPLDISALFPTTDDSVEMEIDSSDVGITGDFDDGVYIITYRITMLDTSVYSKTCYVFFSCQADCCVNKLYAKVTTTACRNCNDSKLDFAFEADGFLKAARSKAGCGDISGANELLAKVQYMCNLQRCNC